MPTRIPEYGIHLLSPRCPLPHRSLDVMDTAQAKQAMSFLVAKYQKRCKDLADMLSSLKSSRKKKEKKKAEAIAKAEADQVKLNARLAAKAAQMTGLCHHCGPP